MKSIAILGLVILASVSASVFDCAYVSADNEDYVKYFICPLELTQSVLSFTDQVNSTNSTNSTLSANYTLDVSLAGGVVNACNTSSTQSNIFATYFYANDSNATNSTTCQNISLVNTPIISYLDNDNPQNGLILTYQNATPNSYSIVYQLVCDESAVGVANFTGAAASNGTITVSTSSSYACANSALSNLSYFLAKYHWVFFVLFLILGGLICFAGLTFLKYTIFTVGALFGTGLTAFLLFKLCTYGTATWIYWLILFVCLVIGCVVGYVAIKVETLGFVVLGAVLGYTGGLLVYNAFLAPFLVGKIAAYYLFVILCGFIGAAVAYKTWKSFVIFGTAVLGSYMVVRAIGNAVGNFPSEEAMAQGTATFTGITYAYLVFVVVLAVAGGYVQHRHKKSIELEAEEAEDVHGYQRVMAGYNA